MSKRIFSLVMTLLLVFSMVTPSFAAGLKDVEDTKYVEAITRLDALGILQGYEDGTFRPERTITRAEFATVAMRALGLDATAKSSNGITAFSDVSGTHWASGYINLATSKGIIKGYPDGTFKPEKQVTYAEVVTMLVRLLGYEPAVNQTNWPSNYLVKAAEIGITGNLNFDQSAPATRGDVAILTNNSLDIDLMETETWGTDIEYKEQNGETLLTEYLNVHELEEAIVSQTAGYSQGKLDTDEVEIKYDEDEDGNYETFIFQSNVNVENLLGHEVTLFVKDDDDDGKVEDDEVVLMATSTTDARDIIAWDWIDSVSKKKSGDWDITDADNGIEVTLDETDDTFDLSDDAVVYYNHEKIDDLTDFVSEKLGVGYAYLWEVAGTVILDDDDDIIFMNMTNYDNPVVITEVNVDNEELKYFWRSDDESTLDLDSEEYIIYKNGEYADFEDLDTDDVLYYWELSDGSYVLEAYSGSVSGTLEQIDADSNIYWDYSLVVDGTTIYVGPNFTMSTDENDSIDLLGKPYEDVADSALDTLEDMVGHEVTVYLGKYQEATDGWNYGRHIVSNVDSNNDEVFMVSEKVWNSKTTGDYYYIELLNKEDQEVVYELTEDDTDFNGKTLDLSDSTDFDNVKSAFPQGTLVEVEFNADGTISSIDSIDAYNGARLTNVDDDYDILQFTGAPDLIVTEKTAFYDATNNEAIDYETLVDYADDHSIDFNVKGIKVDDDEDDELEAIVFDGPSDPIAGSDYAFVLRRTVKSDGLYVIAALENAWAELFVDTTKTPFKEGNLVNVDIDGSDITDVNTTDNSAETPATFSVTADVYGTDMTSGAFLNADITVNDGSTDVDFVLDKTIDEDNEVTKVEVYKDVNGNGEYDDSVDTTLLGTWEDDKFVAQSGYDFTFVWSKLEISSGGVSESYGKVKAFPVGGDEDIDEEFTILVDKYNIDSYFYDVDVSHMADPDTKILELADLTDGDIIKVYNTDTTNAIYEYIIVVDR